MPYHRSTSAAKLLHQLDRLWFNFTCTVVIHMGLSDWTKSVKSERQKKATTQSPHSAMETEAFMSLLIDGTGDVLQNGKQQTDTAGYSLQAPCQLCT